MTRRRIGLLITFTFGFLLAPIAAEAQGKPRLPMVGVLTSAAGPSRLGDGLLQSLSDLGYVEGDNLTLEERYAGGTAERLVALAVDMVRQEVAVIVASGYAAVRAAQDATHTIPIVMLLGGDPIGSGLIPRLTRPGGNLTGVAALSSKLSAKRLALLKTVVPAASQVAVLFNPDDVSKALDWTQTQAAARGLGVRLQPQEVRDPHTLGQAFAAMRQAHADALITFGDVFTLQHRTRIVTFATQSQLPAIYELKPFVEAGGLMAYGPRPKEMFQRVAGYVDKILKGAKPGDLPVEQPTTFELVINLKTAKALGLTIPPSLLSQADEVIR
ncbi:MAG: ABC transporter substrate-binding protein [Candidatus Tectomicrobia bacterium]|nr:ABC transporter substrate-binding protein [Candidatus Tectomicrobia bacterium]